MPDHIQEHGAVLVQEGKIVRIGYTNDLSEELAELVIDGGGDYLSPGVIDLHTHGGGGGSFLGTEEEEFRTGLRTHLSHGATTILPTVIVRKKEQMEQLAVIHDKLQKEDGIPHFPGYFLEGPYTSTNPAVQGFRKKEGPDPVICPEDYLPILEAGKGHILRWMAAPELKGAGLFAETIKEYGIRPCMGHCAPVYGQIDEAMKHGFDCTVHLYSAMSTITREKGFRKAGLLETTLLRDDLISEIVADGCHVPKELFLLAVKCKGYDQLMLISDSCPYAGAANGQKFTMLGCQVMVEDGVCKLADRSAFAGSVVCGLGLVQTVCEQFQIPLWAAFRMAAKNPARYMGWEGQKGELAVGADADFLLFNDRFDLHHVYLKGQEIK